MLERIKRIQNPLTVIGLFATLAEVAATAVLGLLDKGLQSTFIWFVMGFPVLLVVLFFLTLNFNPKVLYAPSDFRSDESYLKLLWQKGSARAFAGGATVDEASPPDSLDNRLIELIGRYGGRVSTNALADELGTRQSDVLLRIYQLVERGFIRSVPDGDDFKLEART